MRERFSLVANLPVDTIPGLCSGTILFSHTKLYSLGSEEIIGVFQRPGMKCSCIRVLVGFLEG